MVTLDFDQVKGKVGMITPVPGGVGPMTNYHAYGTDLSSCSS